MTQNIGVGIIALHTFDCGHDIEVIHVAESEESCIAQAVDVYAHECPVCTNDEDVVAAINDRPVAHAQSSLARRTCPTCERTFVMLGDTNATFCTSLCEGQFARVEQERAEKRRHCAWAGCSRLFVVDDDVSGGRTYCPDCRARVLNDFPVMHDDDVRRVRTYVTSDELRDEVRDTIDTDRRINATALSDATLTTCDDGFGASIVVRMSTGQKFRIIVTEVS
jgi:hypothetical protein